jgi:hypothetical protein
MTRVCSSFAFCGLIPMLGRRMSRYGATERRMPGFANTFVMTPSTFCPSRRSFSMSSGSAVMRMAIPGGSIDTSSEMAWNSDGACPMASISCPNIGAMAMSYRNILGPLYNCRIN